MNKNKSGLMLVAGAVFGLSVALCIGAVEKSKAAPKQDWSHLQFWGYPNGTGMFDPNTGKIYVYDADLRNCYLIRQLVTPGEPLR